MTTDINVAVSKFGIDPYNIGLQRRQRQVLEVLIKADTQPVTMERIVFAIYGDDPDGGPLAAEQSIHAFVSKLRKKISHFGLFIDCTRFDGYRLRLGPRMRHPDCPLTDKQIEIVRMIADGQMLKNISEHYRITIPAIWRHLQQARANAGHVPTPAGLVAKAIRSGWIQ